MDCYKEVGYPEQLSPLCRWIAAGEITWKKFKATDVS
jgi:hypothetical protein